MTSPQPGTVVVNVADLLARWSNDVLRSTLRRVVAPPQPIGEFEVVTPKRQSIAFFCNPNFDTKISCLPHCFGPGNPRKYDPVITEEYIVRRLLEICKFSGRVVGLLSTSITVAIKYSACGSVRAWFHYLRFSPQYLRPAYAGGTKTSGLEVTPVVESKAFLAGVPLST